jgi:DNA-binding transcriptional MerR regulator
MVRSGTDRNVMQIGDFARLAGVSVRAIRYYEELGLISPEGHSIGGFRLYGDENLKRIEVINHLKDLGLTLNEIRDILTAKRSAAGGREAVAFLQKTLQEKLDLVESKLGTLNQIKAELASVLRILRSCEHCRHEVLLDAILCAGCEDLQPRETVPGTFDVILR